MGIVVRKNTKHLWYDFRFNGRRIQESAGTSDREEAEQVEAKRKRDLWAESRLGVKPKRAWEDAVVSYVSTLVEGRNKEQTKAELLWFGQHLMGRDLSTINLDVLENLQQQRAAAAAERIGRPPKPGTINRAMGIIMAVLHHAVSKRWIDFVPALAHLPDTNKVIRFITREQAEKLLAELPIHLRRMVVFALETGLRKSNVTQLHWEQVDLTRRIAWVDPDKAKEGKGIPVPLSATAVALLESVSGEHPVYCFVFRNRAVKQTSTKAWKEAKRRAGIKNFRWHDLRHTWASWHRQDGTPPAVLKELGGWTDDRMPGRYAHLGDDHLAEFVNRRQGLATKVTTEAAEAKQRIARK